MSNYEKKLQKADSFLHNIKKYANVNKSRFIIVPLIDNLKDINISPSCINSYMEHEDLKGEDMIFLEFSLDSDIEYLMRRYADASYSYILSYKDDTQFILVFDKPKIQNEELFIEGNYTEFSKKSKERIFSKTFCDSSSYVYHCMFADENSVFKHMFSDEFGIHYEVDELMSKPDMKKETLKSVKDKEIEVHLKGYFKTIGKIDLKEFIEVNKKDTCKTNQ